MTSLSLPESTLSNKHIICYHHMGEAFVAGTIRIAKEERAINLAGILISTFTNPVDKVLAYPGLILSK